MAEHLYPELVQQRSHQVGMEPPKTFEETLRELLRSSPYLVISVVFHALLLVLFANLDPTPDKDLGKTIKASAEEIEEPIPPPPPPPEPEVEKIEEIIEDPVISEEDVTEVEEFEQLESLGEFDSTGLNDVIGVGGGGGGNFGKLGRRRSKGRAGGEAIAAAVDDALKWLKNHQNLTSGHWSCAAFDEECGRQDPEYTDPCDGLGSPQFDVGVTSLAVLAYLGAGHTHKEGKYKQTVKAGLRYLVDVQDRSSGNFGDERNGKYTYDHLIATLAMVEAYALTKDYMFKASAEKSLEYMYSIRNPTRAWRYAEFNPDMAKFTDDVSVTGWAILAMTLAKEYNMPFDETALEDSLAYLEEMTDDSGVTGYAERGGGPAREAGFESMWPNDESESMTAVGVLCRIFADPNLERPGNKALVDKGAQLIADLPPIWDDNQPGRRDFYFWYYGTYALYQYGGPTWTKWERHIVDAIVEPQEKEGELKGSWDPSVDPWGSFGGRVYSTSILALTMEVFYRYDSVMGSH